MYSECCGAIVYDDYDLCSECLEHCDVWEDDDADDDYLAQVEQLLKLGPELEVEKEFNLTDDEAMTILNVMQKESERRFDDSKEAS
jgi:hypothetical protein